MTFVGIEHSLMYDGTLSLGGFALDVSGPARSCNEQSGCPVACAAPCAVCCVLDKVDFLPPPSLTLLKKGPPYELQGSAAFYARRRERG